MICVGMNFVFVSMASIQVFKACFWSAVLVLLSPILPDSAGCNHGMMVMVHVS